MTEKVCSGKLTFIISSSTLWGLVVAFLDPGDKSGVEQVVVVVR